MFSIDNFNRNLLTGALSNGLNDGADLTRDTTLAADQLAHILGRNVKLKRGDLALDLIDLNLIGIVD